MINRSLRKVFILSLVAALLVTLLPLFAAKSFAADRGVWAPYTNYSTGDTVTYGVNTYAARQNHQSLPGTNKRSCTLVTNGQCRFATTNGSK
ncbi:carbohydrate-binding protein [Paenibacillus segetis]|uniref:carbohydrate-binding protein n=1 Tax=Paenibacillus segetis TaxID=1325360 RepID=UPI003570BA3F